MCKIVSLIVSEVVPALFSVLEPGPAGRAPGRVRIKCIFYLHPKFQDNLYIL